MHAFRLSRQQEVVARERLLGAAGRIADVCIHEDDHSVVMTANVSNDRPAGDAWHYARSLRIDLALSDPASSTFDGRWSSWSLESGCGDRVGPVKDAASWLAGELWDGELVESDPAFQVNACAGDWRDDSQYLHTLQRIHTLCRLVGDRAVSRCDTEARARARTLSPDARFFAYAAQLRDPSGSVAQMVATCPGLMTLAAALEPHQGAGAALIEGIIAGRKLAKLIQLTLQATAARLGLTPHALRIVWHAPPLSHADLLAVLRAPGIDINDLHAADDRRADWYELMAAWGRASRRISDAKQAARLGGFVSKHALTFCEEARGWQIDALIDWVERSRARTPHRRSSPTRVRDAIADWHARLNWLVEHSPSTRLPTSPVAPRSIAGLDIAPLTTVGELMSEGMDMKHCVASLSSWAIAGDVHLYRATALGVRATIAITRELQKWQLLEAAGRANEPLPSDHMTLIERWVETLS